ncbi:hypothetical protein BDY19DRAFT_939439 [Irpex rosettiformis]|uniref:Uncharacterized protein n=1 Tax=Irpex rosettiformis TaxID=378272 RepID=A0ACB8U8L0_9APHY|nr:hypothetical protein BDY19DRAFT_939439 [Irpex rosettiformis]
MSCGLVYLPTVPHVIVHLLFFLLGRAQLPASTLASASFFFLSLFCAHAVCLPHSTIYLPHPCVTVSF